MRVVTALVISMLASSAWANDQGPRTQNLIAAYAALAQHGPYCAASLGKTVPARVFLRPEVNNGSLGFSLWGAIVSDPIAASRDLAPGSRYPEITSHGPLVVASDGNLQFTTRPGGTRYTITSVDDTGFVADGVSNVGDKYPQTRFKCDSLRSSSLAER
jgi:hypothetical protein